MNIHEKYELEIKNAKKIIRRRHAKKAKLAVAIALIFCAFGAVCWVLKIDAGWADAAVFSSPLFAFLFLIEAVRSLVRYTAEDEKLIDQINQAYLNAKMSGNDSDEQQ